MTYALPPQKTLRVGKHPCFTLLRAKWWRSPASDSYQATKRRCLCWWWIAGLAEQHGHLCQPPQTSHHVVSVGSRRTWPWSSYGVFFFQLRMQFKFNLFYLVHFSFTLVSEHFLFRSFQGCGFLLLWRSLFSPGFFFHFGEVKSSSPGLVRTAFSLNPNFWSMSPMIRNWACTPRDPQWSISGPSEEKTPYGWRPKPRRRCVCDQREDDSRSPLL